MEKTVVKRISKIEDDLYQQLKVDCLNLAEKLNWNNGLNQIMLQTYDPNIDDFITGIGRIKEAKFTDETAYQYIQPSLAGTSIDRFLSSINVCRTRLMLLGAKSCYSIHQDPGIRLHVALKTNPQCYFLFPELNQFKQIPDNGMVYHVDTREMHSFVNCGSESRIHLVMCTKG